MASDLGLRSWGGVCVFDLRLHRNYAVCLGGCKERAAAKTAGSTGRHIEGVLLSNGGRPSLAERRAGYQGEPAGSGETLARAIALGDHSVLWLEGERATDVEPALSHIGSLEPEEGEIETLEPAREQSAGFCRKCGTDNPGDSRFCRGCGAPLLEEQETQEEVTVVGTIGEPPPTMDQQKPKQPWYFSTTFLALTFLFFTPLWGMLILADRRHGRGLKAFAGLLIAAYILLFAYILGGAQFGSALIGPATIEFGSSYVETGNGVVIENPRSAFYYYEELAWVVHLRGPAKTTSLDLVVSTISASGGEQVVDSGPMRLAHPDFQVLYGRYPLSSLGRGHHRLRVMSGDNTLAEGDFEVR